MSVYTLQETPDGGVVIGANITKGEAPAAGRQILTFCYRISNEPEPLVLDRVEVNTDTGYHQHGWSVERLTDGRVHFTVNRYLEPDEVLHFAAVAASFATEAANEPSHAEIEEVVGYMPPEVPVDLARKTARWLLTRYEFTERTS